MRFELCWRHFDFHARQRTQLFHFFIILTPFVFGGCFILFKERASVGEWPAIVAAVSGALVATIFFLLDRRNKQLYRVSESCLKLIESQFLFTSFRPLQCDVGNFPGVITREDQLHGIQRIRSHTFLMGAAYSLAIILFMALALYFLLIHCGCISLPSPPTTGR
jgi:uncharacterized membrane protein YbhN (UPF0104 family)